MVAADTASFPSTVTGILQAAMGTQGEAVSSQENAGFATPLQPCGAALFTVTAALPYSSAPVFTFDFWAELSPSTDWHLFLR